MTQHGVQLEENTSVHDSLSTDAANMLQTTRPAQLAWVLLGLSVIGFLAISGVMALTPDHPQLTLLTILRHGFEGAMVGCICDIIAVRNVYTKARDHFEPLVENVSKAVVIDMIRLRTLIERFSRLDDLQNEANQDWFRQQLQALIPSKDRIEAQLETYWQQSLWHETAFWLAEIDLHPILTGSSDHSMRLLEVPELRNTLATLMEVATEDRNLTGEMHARIHALGNSFTLSDLGIPSEPEALEELLVLVWEHWKIHQPERGGNLKDSAQDWLIQKVITRVSVNCAPVVSQTTIVDILMPILDEAQVTDAMHELAKRIREEAQNDVENSHELPLLFDSLILYLGALADAWSTLPLVDRQRTMVALLDAWKPVVLSLLGDVLWWLRIKLMQPDEILAMPGFQKMLIHLSEQGREQTDNIEALAVDSLHTRLKALGKVGFVKMLQRHTQQQLDWIKVNGIIFGFFMGLSAGGLAVLIEYYLH